MKCACFLALLLAAPAGCSKKSEPPAPGPGPSLAVSNAAAVQTSAPVAQAAPRVETVMTSDDAKDPGATRTFETWLTVGATKHLLARNGISPEDETVKESPVVTSLSDGRVHYEFDGQNVPSTWVGTMSADFSVSPLALVREETNYFNRMQGCPHELTQWSWSTLTGTVAWSCERGAKCEKHEYLPIPEVTLPDGYGEGGSEWGCHRIAGCSVEVDGTKGHGFVTFGERRAGDPTFLAVVSGRWLFVQLELQRDADVGEGDGGDWVGQDHLEIWVAAEAASYMGCEDLAAAQQWGVRIADARVFAGAGAAAPLLRAERAACDPRTIAFRIELPEKHDALTVAYSEGTGNKQRSLIATSRVVFGDTASLGRVKHVDPKRVTCQPAKGGLAPVAAPVASGEPIATFE